MVESTSTPLSRTTPLVRLGDLPHAEVVGVKDSVASVLSEGLSPCEVQKQSKGVSGSVLCDYGLLN